MSLPRSRPNVLLIITDQHRADYLGCTGHPTLRTPNIDALAMHGLRFRNFFVSTPVCMPNRATLMTGRVPSVHGVRHNGIPLSRQATTFVELLAAAGYQTALIGKSHLQTQSGRPPIALGDPIPDGLEPPPDTLREARRGVYDGDYTQELPARWKQPGAKVETPFYGFDTVKLCKGHGTRMTGDYRNWLAENHPDPDAILSENAALPNTYTVPQAWRTALPEHLYPTHYIGQEIGEFIENRDPTRPFFAMASFPDPHHPFTPPGRYWDMYRPEDMEVPAAFRRDGWVPPPHVKALHEAYDRRDPITDHIMAHGIGEKEALEARALTCGAISCIDDAVGNMLSVLDAQALRDNTVVIFTSDHGEHLGEHKLLLKGMAHYDELIRVPMIWSELGRAGNGGWTDAISGTIDIGTSILARAGLAPCNGNQGRSFLDLLDHPERAHRDAFLIEDEQQRTVEGLGPRPRARTVIDGTWRLSLYPGHTWGELYSLEEDPGEFHNLWDHPSATNHKSRLLEKISTLMAEACDRSPMPMHQA